MRGGVVIQARLASTRLPGKVLLPGPDGRPLLRIMLARIALANLGLPVIVATTTAPEDRAIVDCAAAAGVHWFRGPVDDVVQRFLGAADIYNLDAVFRLTADCPLIDPETLRYCWQAFSTSLLTPDYLGTSQRFPEGFDTEVFSIDFLRRAAAKGLTAPEREHLSLLGARHATRHVVVEPEDVNVPGEFGAIRVTLDEAADHTVICGCLQRLGIEFTLRDLVQLHRNDPWRFTANRDIERNSWLRQSIEREAAERQ